MTQAGHEAMAEPENENLELNSAPNDDAAPTTPGAGSNDGELANLKDVQVDPVDLVASDDGASSKTDNADHGSVNGDVSPKIQRRDSLRRTSSKIANLRAAFEKNGASLSPAEGPKRRFEPSPARNAELELEIAKLKDKLEHEFELRQAYEEKCTSLEEAVDELQMKLDNKEQSWKTDFTHRTKELQEQLQRTTEDADNAQRQLSDIKRSISTATRMDSQLFTDSAFVQEFEVVYHEVQNFVVNQYRRTKAELTGDSLVARFDGASEPTEHSDSVRSMLANFDSAYKIPIFQAITVAQIVDIFQEPMLFGLPVEEEWYQTICKAADELPMVLPAAAFNKWRAVTLDVIRRSDNIIDSIESSSKRIAENICGTMDAITGVEASQSRVVSLTGIAKRAVSLAHMFRVQKAHYVFLLPATDTPFDPSTMEDTSEDSHPTFASTVRCAMFPAVIKLGDEEGDNIHKLSNVVVRAKVLCIE